MVADSWCQEARWKPSRLARAKRVLLLVFCVSLCLFYANLHKFRTDYGDSAVVIVEESLPEVDSQTSGITDPTIKSNGNTTNLTISREIKLIATPKKRPHVRPLPPRILPAPMKHPVKMSGILETNKSKNPVFSCRQILLSKTKQPVTALASFAGSGSTWARHLIQQVTGDYLSRK